LEIQNRSKEAFLKMAMKYKQIYKVKNLEMGQKFAVTQESNNAILGSFDESIQNVRIGLANYFSSRRLSCTSIFRLKRRKCSLISITSLSKCINGK